MDRQTHTEIQQLKNNISLLSKRVTHVEQALSQVQTDKQSDLVRQDCKQNSVVETELLEKDFGEPANSEPDRQWSKMVEEKYSTSQDLMESARGRKRTAETVHDAQEERDRAALEKTNRSNNDSTVSGACSERLKNIYKVETGKPEILEKQPQDTGFERKMPERLPKHQGIDAKPKKDSLELEIGLYWLNRLGITSLVIGVALLLMYSFQFFGPLAKIATGLVMAAGLLVGGEWMEKKGGPKWYARSLMGGGWSIAYFTVFAMNHVPSVKVIADQNLDCILLYAVAFCAMRHCIKIRSELTALFALVLGIITFALSEPSIASAMATAILVESVCSLSRKLGWTRLYFGGLLGSYGTAFYLIAEKLSRLTLDDPGKLLVTAAYLVPFWVSYVVTSLIINEDSVAKGRTIVVASVLNFIFFAPLMAMSIDSVYPSLTCAFVLAVAAVYAYAAQTARVRMKTGIEQV
ncbi:MAG: DUF2339 domain-containing protein, partial [Cyanobacteria bacterium]|nr:DUF2339 domain-containing protein [Cyanobacteriota bacterium]